RLRRLQSGAAAANGSRVRAEFAVETTQLFFDHYAHAQPFDPAALLDVWRHCVPDRRSVDVCRNGVHLAEELVLGKAPSELKEWAEPEGESESTHQAAPPEHPAVHDEAEGDEPATGAAAPPPQ